MAASSEIAPAPEDSLGRPLHKLRISVTDRCNLRCSYCMPRESYTWLPREHLLTFDEITRLVRVLATLGIGRLRLTGGEPLLRRDLAVLVAQLAHVEGIRSVALTTNGVLLAEQASALHSAGLQGLTVSLDSLREDRFERIAGRARLHDVLAGLDRAHEVGFERMKTNTVVVRGFNDDELVDLVELARARQIEPRFIEYMDVGGATDWRPESVVSREDILARLAARYGTPLQLRNRDGAPADRFQLPDGMTVGIISSTSQPFCRSCDRARLTSDGMLLTCLYAQAGLDLRGLLRGGADDRALGSELGARWRARADRGAEERLELGRPRGPWVAADALVRDPHLEMHKRGG